MKFCYEAWVAGLFWTVSPKSAPESCGTPSSLIGRARSRFLRVLLIHQI
jgi:hypothetical protein